VTDGDLRIWCAGCSSGEEAYTLEIIMHEYFAQKSGKWDTELLATDISTVVLDKAVFGVYSNEQIAPLSEDWKRNYFKKYDENNVVVTDEIKRKITYRRFNLMENKFSFKKKFNVIFCRNVMIYFDAPTREKLINNFYDASAHGAYLFIGHSESLNSINTKYKYVMPALYRKE
jgi:chemotaxis protein methyltransferase CheR